MNDSFLLHDLVLNTARATPNAVALVYENDRWTYEQLSHRINSVSQSLIEFGLERMDRVGVFLEKCFEFVTSSFAISQAGGVFVPINHSLKSNQIQHILNDCQIRILITSIERLPMIEAILSNCPHLQIIILRGDTKPTSTFPNLQIIPWKRACENGAFFQTHRTIDSDVVAIFYTSGSTGKPKGVVLSHKNMVTGAKSVASYLQNNSDDVLIAALPFSFDAGFSQLTTGFYVGAQIVLTNYFSASDLIATIARHKVTGMTAVPPLWMQILQSLPWPPSISENMRYFANTGGKMPFEVLQKLKELLPNAKPYLMYGLTEAFRATYLPPEQVEKRPHSIGKSIPNSEILILNEAGNVCAADEIGEIVQRGPLVSLGYWNDPEKTSERFKTLPKNVPGKNPSLMIPEVAVYSGDFAKTDSEGFIYFIGRKDEMIKTSGYRVSPNEVEDVLYSIPGIIECAAFGIEKNEIGQAIVAVVFLKDSLNLSTDHILKECKKQMPNYMVPSLIQIKKESLPRNSNGKIDRKKISFEYTASVTVRGPNES